MRENALCVYIDEKDNRHVILEITHKDRRRKTARLHLLSNNAIMLSKDLLVCGIDAAKNETKRKES